MSQNDTNFKLFAMFIGRSGSGKSAAAASLPKPMEELDFDLRANGIRNCIQQGWLKIEEGKDIVFKQFDPFKGYLQVEQYLNLKYVMVGAKQFNLASMDIGSLTSLVRLLDLTSLASVGADGKNNHLNIGGLTMTGPADYKFESAACHKIMDFLRVLPCHVTISAHIVNQYGKAPGAKNDYAPSVIIGEKLTITANLGENILAMFNDVYKFSKEMINGTPHFFVEFSSEIAKNTFNLPAGKFDVTQREFWPYFLELIEKSKLGNLQPPQIQQTVSGSGIL